jgi:hypothetical protein
MPRSPWSLVAVSLTSVLLATGCAPHVNVGNPRPNVDLPRSETSLALELDAAIPDTFKATSGGSSAPSTPVKEWRTTLERGFQNSFGPAFKTDGGKDLVLHLVEVVLEVAPTTEVDAAGSAVGSEAQIRYKARLVDAQGNVVRRSVGTVSSKRPVARSVDATRVAESAVESMYEKIAEDLFYNQAPVSESSR